jgi:hypothetical protein
MEDGQDSVKKAQITLKVVWKGAEIGNFPGPEKIYKRHIIATESFL